MAYTWIEFVSDQILQLNDALILTKIDGVLLKIIFKCTYWAALVVFVEHMHQYSTSL